MATPNREKPKEEEEEEEEVFCKVKKLVDYWQYFSNFFGYSTLVNNGFGRDTRLSEVEK